MKNKTVSALFAAAFLVMSLLPSAGMLIFGPSEPSANEILAQAPVLISKDGGFNPKVLSDVTDYIADRFAFRKQLVTAWARLNAGIFGASVESQVILGTDGWLYYTPTMGDYMGESLPDEQLVYAARNLALMQEYSESRGARFLFAIAPNKNSLYPGNMPKYIPASQEGGNAERLFTLLEKNGVSHADLFTVFKAQGDILYYRTDSHWTDRGAALAADAILSAVGRDTAFYSSPFSRSGEHIGDLYEMLYPASARGEVRESVSGGFAFTEKNSSGDANAMRIETENTSASGSVVCWRDSFGMSLYPYIADSFGSGLFLRATSYDLTQIDKREADTVIIELVERNIIYLTEYAPVLVAPTREIGEYVEVQDHVSYNSKRSDGLACISGNLPADADAQTRVYIVTDGGVFEACVTFSSSGRVFTAHIDETLAVRQIAFYSQGVLTAFWAEAK